MMVYSSPGTCERTAREFCTLQDSRKWRSFAQKMTYLLFRNSTKLLDEYV